VFEIKLKTFYKDGREVETVASAEHFVEWEDHFGQPVLEAINATLTNLYYLAWLTTPGVEFKEWLKTVRDVDTVKDATPIVPFDPAPSDGP